MSEKDHKTPKQNNKITSNGSTTILTNLPGLTGVQVIVSKPSLIKENSSKVSKR